MVNSFRLPSLAKIALGLLGWVLMDRSGIADGQTVYPASYRFNSGFRYLCGGALLSDGTIRVYYIDHYGAIWRLNRPSDSHSFGNPGQVRYDGVHISDPELSDCNVVTTTGPEGYPTLSGEAFAFYVSQAGKIEKYEITHEGDVVSRKPLVFDSADSSRTFVSATAFESNGTPTLLSLDSDCNVAFHTITIGDEEDTIAAGTNRSKMIFNNLNNCRSIALGKLGDEGFFTVEDWEAHTWSRYLNLSTLKMDSIKLPIDVIEQRKWIVGGSKDKEDTMRLTGTFIERDIRDQFNQRAQLEPFSQLVKDPWGFINNEMRIKAADPIKMFETATEFPAGLCPASYPAKRCDKFEYCVDIPEHLVAQGGYYGSIYFRVDQSDGTYARFGLVNSDGSRLVTYDLQTAGDEYYEGFNCWNDQCEGQSRQILASAYKTHNNRVEFSVTRRSVMFHANRNVQRRTILNTDFNRLCFFTNLSPLTITSKSYFADFEYSDLDTTTTTTSTESTSTTSLDTTTTTTSTESTSTTPLDTTTTTTSTESTFTTTKREERSRLVCRAGN